MLDNRGVGGEKVRNATSHRILRRKSRQTRGHRLSRDHANNSVREKIEAGQHTTRLQIGARMMAKNNLLGDRVPVSSGTHKAAVKHVYRFRRRSRLRGLFQQS